MGRRKKVVSEESTPAKALPLTQLWGYYEEDGSMRLTDGNRKIGTIKQEDGVWRGRIRHNKTVITAKSRKMDVCFERLWYKIKIFAKNNG